MKRTFLISCALGAAALAPASASAEPGIIYIPTEDLTLYPTGMVPCGSSTNSGLDCAAIQDETDIPAYGGDLMGLMTGLETGLAEYDIMITNDRPPPYISYTMMFPEAPLNLVSLTCSSGGINCGARKRNGFIFMVPMTQNCMMPDMLHAALYAVGRASGLEGVMNPMDVMNFPPDFMMPVTTFLDECSFRAHQQNFDDMGMPSGEANLECTSLDHTSDCPEDPDGDPGQNSHQDMLEYYGPPLEDTDPPELSNIVPTDGEMLDSGADLILDVDIADADVVVGARWTVYSPALEEFVDGGIIDYCTNDACSDNWQDATPLKPTDSDWEVAFNGLPDGEYTITLEAADYHGNVAEPVMMIVTIGDPTAGSSGSVDETGGNDSNNGTGTPPPFTSGFDETAGDDDGDTSTTGQDEDGGGCSCRTTPARGGAVLMLLGLMGLGAMRRRW